MTGTIIFVIYRFDKAVYIFFMFFLKPANRFFTTPETFAHISVCMFACVDVRVSRYC